MIKIAMYCNRITGNICGEYGDKMYFVERILDNGDVRLVEYLQSSNRNVNKLAGKFTMKDFLEKFIYAGFIDSKFMKIKPREEHRFPGQLINNGQLTKTD